MSEVEARALLRLSERLIRPGGSDEDAAAHERCFGREVFLHSGVYLGAEAQVGGGDASQLVERYRRIGVPLDPLGEEPDHLSTQLRALAWLTRAEADARRGFLDGALLPWLPIWASGARRVGGAAPGALASEVERVVLGLREGLGGGPAPWELPPSRLDLDASDTGLREITGWLSTPSRCGLLVSGEDIARLGREIGVPRGFGGRRLLLGNLLRGAGQFGRGEALIEGLVRLVDGAREELQQGPAAAFCGPWLDRMAESSGLLARMKGGLGPG